MMSHQKVSSIVSPANQSATFIELFFDLIFVFSITQVVGLLHHGLTWLVVVQAILIFWLVWWAWTQFTWALNAADTTHPWVELGTLLATAVAFFMAVTLPEAFRGHGLWFALPYVLVRAIGLILYIWVAWTDPTQRLAVRRFGLVSLGGLAAVLLGGFFGGAIQFALWTLVIVLDILAAIWGAQADGWNLHPEHFSERHGLFVIIALGETLIIAASGATGATWSNELISVAILAVAITCGLWWSYFTRAKPQLDHAMESNTGAAQAMLARDVFSLLHFPMLCGVIAYAVAIEEVIAHPVEPLHLATRVIFVLGLAFFLGSMSLAIWRATQRVLLARLGILVIVVALILGLPEVTPTLTMTITLAGIVIIAVVEQLTLSPQGSVHP